MIETPKRLLDGGGAGPERAAVHRLLSQLPKTAQDPPETERRWQENVWRRLRAGRRAPRAVWFALAPPAAAAVGAVAVAVLLWLRLPARPGPSPLVRLDEAAGRVQSAEEAGFAGRREEAGGDGSRNAPAADWREAREGDALLVRSRLRTDRKSHALLALAGVARVLLNPGSELSIAAVGPETVLRLVHGGVRAQVTKRPPGQSFVIELHGYRVRVVGTVFSVDEGEGGSVHVGVSEGVVEVLAGDGRSWRVAAGASWSSAQAPATLPPRASNPSTVPVAPAQLGSGPRPRPRVDEFPPEARPRDPDEGRTAQAQAAPSAIPSRPEPLPAPPPPPSPALPATAPPPIVLAPDRTVALAGPVVAASAPPAARVGPAPAAAEPTGAPPSLTRDLYAQASSLSAHGRYAEAAAELQTLIEGGGPHLDLALYELARLRQAHLGDLPGAIELFDRYRSSYPHGALEPEAGLSIIQAELARGELDRARTEMDRFLAEHPGSERAEEVHLLRGNVLREARQCAQAIEDYRLCKDPGVADDALYFTAWCEKRLGHAEAAIGALRGYLKRFPAGRHLDDVRQALHPAE